ncbi:MAG: hypothetical protein HOY78_02690 [Saccharothrix sp.]|nr:hypothetical protein [Saccharothrix sp.]
MTNASRPRCATLLESHGRRFHCNRPTAAKWGHRYCGHCAAAMNCKPLAGGKRVHKPSCLGCGMDCCTDRSKCVPGLCSEFVDRRYRDITAEDVRRAAAQADPK